MTDTVDLGTAERHRQNGGVKLNARVQTDAGIVTHLGAAATCECALDAIHEAGLLDGTEGSAQDRKAVGRSRYEAGLTLRRIFIKAGLVGVRAANMHASGGNGEISDAAARARMRFNATMRLLGAYAEHTTAYCCQDHAGTDSGGLAALRRGLDRLCLEWQPGI